MEKATQDLMEANTSESGDSPLLFGIRRERRNRPTPLHFAGGAERGDRRKG